MPGASRPQNTDIDCCANQRCTAILLVLHTWGPFTLIKVKVNAKRFFNVYWRTIWSCIRITNPSVYDFAFAFAFILCESTFQIFSQVVKANGKRYLQHMSCVFLWFNFTSRHKSFKREWKNEFLFHVQFRQCEQTLTLAAAPLAPQWYVRECLSMLPCPSMPLTAECSGFTLGLRSSVPQGHTSTCLLF